VPTIEHDDLDDLRTKINRMNAAGAKQALLGMAEILNHRPSVLAHLFKLIIEDAVKLTIETDAKTNGRTE